MKDAMHIWALLDLVHKTVGLPKLKAIHDAAEAELVEIAKGLGPVPADADLVRTSDFVEPPRVIPNPDAAPSEPPIYPEDSGTVERKV